MQPDIWEEWWRPACVQAMLKDMWSTRCRRACDMIMDQSNKEDNESMDDPADGGALAISEGTMAGDQKGELTKDEKLLLKAMKRLEVNERANPAQKPLAKKLNRHASQLAGELNHHAGQLAGELDLIPACPIYFDSRIFRIAVISDLQDHILLVSF
ncbi:hypothetical protein F2Q69_00007287 [Brassica cretica]|uniref:Uncharacterized protein n=1 Tax=Brassica cretica TaxID=69181 RepID=A0A8S9P920_BRACR|nr:hypothetical protein F2Q69_00007287 [Brassica cretica]